MDVTFGAGNCSTDTSAGYYVLTADCNPNVTAKIDFGVTPPNTIQSSRRNSRG